MRPMNPMPTIPMRTMCESPRAIMSGVILPSPEPGGECRIGENGSAKCHHRSRMPGRLHPGTLGRAIRTKTRRLRPTRRVSAARSPRKVVLFLDAGSGEMGRAAEAEFNAAASRLGLSWAARAGNSTGPADVVVAFDRGQLAPPAAAEYWDVPAGADLTT